MIKPMKWHIYHPTEEYPLCWDDMAIEFDSKEDAERYAGMHPEIGDNVRFKEGILYYDGGYISFYDVLELEALEEMTEEERAAYEAAKLNAEEDDFYNRYVEQEEQ